MPVSKEEVDARLKRKDRKKSDRAQWEGHWEDVSKLTLPRKKAYTGPRTPGEKLMREVYDSTAIHALEIMAAGLNSFLTSSVNKWFELRTRNSELMDLEEAKLWIQGVEKKIYQVLNGSNFSNEIHETYIDDGCLGTDILYVEEDEKEVVRFYTRHLSECIIEENNKGRVDTLYREYKFSARQAEQEFGAEALPKDVQKYLKDKPDEQLDFVHMVYPRTEMRSGSQLSIDLPFVSLYVYPKSKHVLKESGYHEFPFMVTRWLKGTGEQYGRSPAMKAYADISQLNEVRKTMMKGRQKAVDPPILLPDQGVVGNVRLMPGGLTYSTMEAFKNNAIPQPMRLNNDFSAGKDEIADLKDSILKYFFVDLFLYLQDNPQMTATEVMERVGERMAILGPVLGRMINEKLDPLIIRVYSIMARQGMFENPPDELANETLEIEYVSPLARAQKRYERDAVKSTIADIVPYIEIAPEIVDNIDPDELFDTIADTYGFPQKARRPQKIIDEIRKRRAEQQEIQAGIEGGAGVAQILGQLQKSGIDVAAT